MATHLRCAKLLIALGLLAGFLSSLAASAQSPRPIPIREALRDTAGSGIPVRIGETLTLRGVLTSDPTLLGSESSVMHLQDNSGGIQLFTPNPALILGQFERGDLVQVRGKLKQYKGMDELLLEEIQFLGRGALPQPPKVQAADLNSRRYLGQLVKITGQLRVPSDFQQQNEDCVLRDGSGEITLYLTPKFLRNPRFIARMVDGGKVTVVGIAGIAKDQPPYNSGFRLMPRDPDDFDFGLVPPYREIAVSLSLLLLLVLFVHLWLRRRHAEQRAREMAILTENIKRSEEALRLSEERFAKAFRSSPDAIAISTLADGRYIDMNDGFVRLTGYQRDEVIGRTAGELKIWVDPAKRDQLVQRLREHGRVSNLEAEFRMKSGEVLFGLMSAEIIDLSGKPCMLTVARDITERRVAERKLEERTTSLNALIENSPLAIVVHDAEDRVQMCNPAFERLFLYRQEEIVNAQLDDLIKTVESPGEPEEITQRVLAGETLHVTTRRRRKNGTIVDVELYAVPLMAQGAPRAAYGLYQDITARVALESQLRQAQKMEAVGRLAGGVAHDFNNLLMVIKGHTELLRDRVDSADPRYRRVEEIEKAADRAASLTKQLLAYSRKQVIAPKVLDLNALVADTGKMLTTLIGEDVELKFLPGSALGRVKADPGQIEQVLLNLAANARDAMPQGGKLTIETANVYLGQEYTRQHADLRQGPYVMLAVSDDGCGMDAETQSHIFEPFFTTKETGKGTGLGLATAFGIVKQSDGHIGVYSSPGQGTTFRVYLPRVDGVVEEAGRGREEIHFGSLRGSETILLVEDEEPVRELVRECLEKNGYTVLEARDGPAAIALSEKHRGTVDVMITDVVMPGMSGRELAQCLGSRRPQMKVLYVSGYTENAVAEHGVMDRGAAFLQKPFRPTDLALKISELLGRQSQEVPETTQRV